MAIGRAEQKGSQVYVYDTNNRLIGRMNGTLEGYTSSTFTVNSGTCTYMYDENMRNIGKC